MSRRRKTEAHAETRRRGVNKGGHSCPPNGELGNSPAGENFVQTELGRLPADWSALPIRDVGEVITGRTPSTKREDFYNGEYNLISPADLDNGKYVVTAHKRLSEVGFKECRALPKDSVLVGCIGNVGKLGMISDERSATNQQINAVICDKNHDSHFIYYCLHENRARLEWAADKTTLPILNKTNFENFEIATPPLPEQRKIAAVLGMVQRALEQQERLIALTTELKKVLLHQLFTQGLRGEPQKQTEIGPVPQSWEVVALGELVEEAPQVNMRTEAERNIQYIDVSSISREFLRIETTSSFVLKDAPGRARKKVKTGDVIFATVRPTLLRVARVAEDYDEQVCSTAFCVLRDKNRNTHGRYIYYLVQRERFIKQLAAIESGVSYPAVTDRQVKEQLVPVPDEGEQIEIARTLEACDAKISMHQRKRVALTALFRTLLHQLMTAQIRVHDLDLPGLETFTGG